MKYLPYGILIGFLLNSILIRLEGILPSEDIHFPIILLFFIIILLIIQLLPSNEIKEKLYRREWAIFKDKFVYNSYKNKKKCVKDFLRLKKKNSDIVIRSAYGNFIVWYPYFSQGFEE
jgi:hypothetical protein